MFRVPKSNGHALGQGRGSASAAHIDAAQQKELGWGYNSFALGFVTYGRSMRERPSAFYVSESALFIINVVSEADPVASMLRRSKDEEKFEVPLSKVVDIKIRKGDLDEIVELPGEEGSYQMTQQAVVRIKGKQDLLYVTTTDSIVFAKQLMGTWQEFIASKAAGLGGNLRTNANKELAYEYYREITRSFGHKSAKRETRAELLNELADEVRGDLEMKSLIFRNRELLVLILDDIANVICEPSGLEKELSMHRSNVSGVSGASILQRKLGNIMQKRLAYIRTCLSFLADLFFCSDAVVNRHHAVGTSEPLDPSSWLDVLQPDLFVLLADRLKFEVDLSSLDKRESDSPRNSPRDSPRQRRASSYGMRDDVGKMIKSVSRSGLNASLQSEQEDRDGEEFYQRHMNSYNMNKSLDPVLLRTRRSVRDLQHVVTVAIYKAMSVGIPGNRPGFGRMHNRVTEARSHMPLGDCWQRFEDFDLNLEHVLMRVGSLLDDMLTSEKVKRGMSAVGKHPKSKAEAAALVAAAVTNSGASKRPSIVELLEASTGGKEPSVRPSPGKKSRAERRGGGAGDQSPRGAGRRGGSSPAKLQLASPARATSPIGKARPAPFGLESVALETQEILLFYTTSLLRALIMDSAKIREVFANELTALWPPIMVTLDVICPRGEAPLEVDPFAADEAAPSAAAKFLSCFKSGELGEDDPYADTMRGLKGSNAMVALQDLHSEMVAKNRQNITLDPLPLNCYGPCRVDIPKESWELLVLSRINVEECMNILRLHGKRHGVNTQGSSSAKGKDAANGGMLGSSKKLSDISNPMRRQRSPRSPRSTRGAEDTENGLVSEAGDDNARRGRSTSQVPFSDFTPGSPALKLDFAGALGSGAGISKTGASSSSSEDRSSADEKAGLLAAERRATRRADRRANAKGSRESDGLLR